MESVRYLLFLPHGMVIKIRGNNWVDLQGLEDAVSQRLCTIVDLQNMRYTTGKASKIHEICDVKNLGDWEWRGMLFHDETPG